MNFQSFFYPPSDANAASQQRLTSPSPRYIRVSQDGVEPLLFALSYLIEYLLAIGRSEGPSQPFEPAHFRSEILGNIFVPMKPDHATSLAESLAKAVKAARDMPFPSMPAPAVKFTLRVRVSRQIVSTYAWVIKQTQKQVVAVWEFRILKTPTEVSSKVTTTGGPAAPPSSSPGFVPSSQLSFASPASVYPAVGNNSSLSSSHIPASASEVGIISVYSNDAHEIRKVIDAVINNAFASIDAEWYVDLRAGDLIFEVDTIF